jgi:predicted lipoprotein with Yx(FWY)xxD motif
MRHVRILIAGIGLAAVAAAGGVTAASVGGSAASAAPSAGLSASAAAAAATVHTAPESVGGKTETILVNGHGLPLYFYRRDTATKSFVGGQLAQLWPPLTSGAPTAGGMTGKVTVVKDTNGNQVAYNGHLLYTFADDHAGQVTGQGLQDFFVATPGLAPSSTSPAPAGTVPAAPSGGSYGY